jgi:hypothetical protein
VTTHAPAVEQDAWLSLVARVGYAAAQRAWPVVAAALARARTESAEREAS